jgi:hypothetical protein
MSNVPLLTENFSNNKHESEINRTNPLGTKGDLVLAYADLINEIWSGHNTYTTPRKFSRIKEIVLFFVLKKKFHEFIFNK